MRYRVDLMPKYRNRPGYPLRPSSITVHNTGNPNATAANHARYLKAEPRSASWHITVDDIEAVLHIPLSEQAWHSGTGAGNTSSIGIEVCEFSDRSRQEATDRNAQVLIADMLTGNAPVGFRTSGLTIANVRTHRSWSGKACPRLLISWWDRFLAGVPLSPVTPAKEAAYMVDVYAYYTKNAAQADQVLKHLRRHSELFPVIRSKGPNIFVHVPDNALARDVALKAGYYAEFVVSQKGEDTLALKFEEAVRSTRTPAASRAALTNEARRVVDAL